VAKQAVGSQIIQPAQSHGRWWQLMTTLIYGRQDN